LAPRKNKDVLLDEEIRRVKALSDAKGLSRALADPRARVVLAAANATKEHEVHGCDAALLEAFLRLCRSAEPAKDDPQCRAKTGVLEAILSVEAEQEDDAYLLGLHYRQEEPVYGGSVDTAADVRGLSVLGLVRVRHPHAAVFAAVALEDEERGVRAAAARALGESSPEAALPLLRHKLEVGDKEAEVIGACMASYLALAFDSGLALSRELLSSSEEPEQEAILLALGESRQPRAFEVLRDYRGRASAVAFVAMAVLRQEPATEHLLGVVAAGPKQLALQSLRALSHFRHDPALCARIRAAAQKRSDPQFEVETEKALRPR
jgi:HEAT repeat protein